MHIQKEKYARIRKEVQSVNATLVAVSKTKPVEAIKELYELGHRDFGENYVQELTEKQNQVPPDIRWHFIGHLQSNKVKYIAHFVHLIHGIDSFKLLKEVNKQAAKNNRVIEVLIQVHIAQEETKFGLDEKELDHLFSDRLNQELQQLKNVRIVGLMGMASFSEDLDLVRNEFRALKRLFDKYDASSTEIWQMNILSMGMSGDYTIALEEGSTMVRIGSLIFGSR
jgi:PLP dependent protein